MNEELAAPILTSVSSAWEAVFVKDLDDHLKQLMCEIKSEVKKFHEQLTPKLLQAGLDEGRLESIRAPLDAALATRTEKAGEKTVLFVHFLYKNDPFTKTGSGQT